MNIQVKRVYDLKKPASKGMFLVDRLWPRGMKKELLGKGEWLKDAAPSTELRAWFHEDKEERFAEFKKKYKKELAGTKKIIREKLGARTAVTLLTGVKDIEQSHIPVLVAFLCSLEGK